MVVRNVLEGKPTTVHAFKDIDDEWQPGSRVWLHARNHADALTFILQGNDPAYYDDIGNMPFRTKPTTHPDWYNIVGDREVSNLGIVTLVGEILDKKPLVEFTDYHSSRPGHDLRYALDGTFLRTHGWEPPMSFLESFTKTVEWYAANPEWLK